MTHAIYTMLAIACMVATPYVIFDAAANTPYLIYTNTPVHYTGTGNEVVLVYGDAPDADWVYVTLNGVVHESAVMDGAFHLTIIAPPPGTYAVTGSWRAESIDPDGSEHVTTGHLSGATLAIFGRGYGDTPSGTATILPGAHLDDCSDCMSYTTDVIEAGGYVLVSNTDSERHQFTTHVVTAVPSTGNLDPGESVRLPFNSETDALYRCVYHPWLEFTVQSTGMYMPDDTRGAIHIDAPSFAGDSVRIAVTHTGAANMAHVIFIQHGRVLEAGTLTLASGYGQYIADASEWGVGEVIVSVSAGADHNTETISVRPPPGAAERSGRITGYDGLDGVLINGGIARPVGLIPLDAAMDATRQVCALGVDAVFRGDIGAGRGGAHYLEGTVWCDGVNLGVYLLESGLAITDPAECGTATSEWLQTYCHTSRDSESKLHIPDEPIEYGVIPTDDNDETSGDQTTQDQTTQDQTTQDQSGGSNAVDNSGVVGGPDSDANVTNPGTPGDADSSPGSSISVDETPVDTRDPFFETDDSLAIPDAGGLEFDQVEVQCDHLTDPECPCPDGWVRNGDWCDPDWYETMDDAGEMVSGAADAVDDHIDDGVGGVRDSIVGGTSDAFDWMAENLLEFANMFSEIGRWFTDQIPWLP